MKVLDSPAKNYFYFVYRLINPVIDPIKFFSGLWGYVWYIRDLIKYKINAPSDKLLGINLFPIVSEKLTYSPFDSHYFFQEIWAMERILQHKPKSHIDIGSKYQFSGFVSLFCKSTYVDIRPIQTHLKNLTITKADILDLPYKSDSVESMSTLHVIEHIGLGRYGDKIDPDGTRKACAELERVLKKNGFLYISLPLGKYRVCFNAHRVHPPETIIGYFRHLTLTDFAAVDDDGKYWPHTDYTKFKNLSYGCGMFEFRK